MSKNISKNYRFVKITILMSFVVLKIAIGTVFFVPIFSQNEQEPMKITYSPEKDTNLIEIPNDLVFTNLSIDDNININKNKLNKEEGEVDVIEEEELEYIKEMTVEATAYVALCDTGCIGITKTGYDVRETIHYEDMRIIAVDPNVIPLYSIVEVDTGEKVFAAIALDTGGDIKSRRIDILMSTTEKAWEFGRRDVEVKIIEWGG